MARRPGEAFDPALGPRVASSIALAAVAVAAVLLGGLAFTLLALATGALMAREWSRLIPGAGVVARRAVAGAAVFGAVLAVVLLAAGPPGAALGGILVVALLAAAGAALLSNVPPDRAAGGVLYVGLPVLALVWLRNAGPDGVWLVLWIFLVVWATDIFAYLVGRSLGGPKLAPRISPGKTWSGLAGGMAGAGLLGGLLGLAQGAGFWFPLALGLILALVAQAGDLFESALKRRAGLKDSGRLIPGHGGLLDRIDGLAFAVPVFAALVWLSGARLP